jgi:hypothetical protein
LYVWITKSFFIWWHKTNIYFLCLIYHFFSYRYKK